MPGCARPGEIKSFFQGFKRNEDTLFVIGHRMKFHADQHAYGKSLMLRQCIVEGEQIRRSPVIQAEKSTVSGNKPCVHKVVRRDSVCRGKGGKQPWCHDVSA